MRDRSLFAVVMALVAGVFFWPAAPRRAEQSTSAVQAGAPGSGGSQATPEGRAVSAHGAISRHGGPHPHVSDAMLLLLADYLALDPHPGAQAQPAGASASTHPHPSDAAAAPNSGAESDAESDLSDAQADRLSREIRDAIAGDGAAGGGITIEPLIVTLPDPIESHAKWMFDRYLDGLSRGITASGYLMDRFGPESWWTTGDPHAAAAATATATAAAASNGASVTTGGDSPQLHHHEGEPGVVLFRTNDGTRLLVLLIVTETATTGVHAHAMMTALDSAANLIEMQFPTVRGTNSRTSTTTGPITGTNTSTNTNASRNLTNPCCTPSPDHTIKLIGPTFSGSALSLKTSADRWLGLRTDACWGLRIVSGSISSAKSRNLLASWDKRVTFQATVPADSALQDAMFDYLKSLNGGQRERVAWVTEDNTAYGLSLAGRKTAADLKPKSKAARAASPVEAPVNVCGGVNPPEPASGMLSSPITDFDRIDIPFPMHVSRLHSEAEEERAQTQARNKTLGPQTLVPLRLGESGSPRDAFPPMTPELTFASVELALAMLLDTIHAEHIRLVAIMATDTRDKLFLAEQIAQRAPDVLLFTLTSDILYLHPDVNDNVRGMLVASAYPLNPVTQSWTPHDRERVLQMQHNSAQGIYNATLALLGSSQRDLSTTDASSAVSNNLAPFLDYGAPGPIHGTGDEVTGPAIWISSVGRDSFWPVAIYDTRATPGHPQALFASFNDGRLIKVRTSRDPRYPVPHLSLSPWASAFFVALAVLALLHIGVYPLGWQRITERRNPFRASAWRALHWLARSFMARPAQPQIAALPAALPAVPPEAHLPIVWNDSNADGRQAPVPLYQLVCVAALWTFFTIPVTLSAIWLGAARIDEDVSPIQRALAWSTAGVAVVAWMALGVLTIALMWNVHMHASPGWWKLWRRPRRGRHWPVTVRLVLWLLALVAIVQCMIDVLRHWPANEIALWTQLPFFMRATTLGNGVTPVVTYFLLTTAFYAWGLINLRRIATPTPMLCVAVPAHARARDWRVALLRRLGFPDPMGTLAELQCRCSDAFLAVPAAAPMIALISALVIYVIILGPTPLTIEGPTFGLAIVLATIVLHVVIGLALLQFHLLWRSLHAFLKQLAQDGLLEAFDALGKRHVRVISAGISLRGPRDIDAFLDAQSPGLARVMGGSGEVDTQTRTDTDTYTETDPIEDVVPSAVLLFLKHRDDSADAPREDIIVATLLALAIQQILTRLGELLAFATIATLLVITAYATFPFGRGPVLSGFGWFYVLIVAITALHAFIQVARDPILGRLKGHENPGAFNWDRDIATKIALYAGIPLFGFISSQFPWLGHVLSQWLQPVQQALPWQ